MIMIFRFRIQDQVAVTEVVAVGQRISNTNLRENFREIFAKFSRVFASFFNFFEVFGLAGTCLDVFGCARMHLGAFGCMRSVAILAQAISAQV